ncbi:MAG: flagellar hook-length control protein FliK [Spirochaetaceae bacterium]|nr:flagellar hook-length control protein FliK [Myxococcales bacterium]MCB9726572.1 flagellar hook-length control protein FliK [Spirochaetaceae bacterium]
MNVDVMSALDGAAAAVEPPARNAGRGDFPKALRSSLDGEDASRARTEGGAAREAKPAREASGQASSVDTRRSVERRPGRDEAARTTSRDETTDRTDGSEDAEAARAAEARSGEPSTDESAAPRDEADDDAIDAATVGAASSVLAEALRAAAGLEAREAVEGSPSELDVDVEAETAGRAVIEAASEDEGEVRDGEIDPEIARELLAEARAAAGETTGEAGREAGPRRERSTRDAVTAVETRDALAEPAEVEAEVVAVASEAVAEEGARDGREENGDAADRSALAAEALADRDAAAQADVTAELASARSVETHEGTVRAPETIAVEGAGQVASPVAGLATETTPVGTPGQPQPAAASEAIAVQTEWLATRGGGTARLVLHPPDLGELAIRVTLRGGAVDVVMVAQEATAQHLAEDQSERLAQAFSSRDLRLEGFEVRRGQPEELDLSAGGRFADARDGREGRGEDAGSREARGAERGVLRGVGGGAREAASVPPRILTTTRPTGVDLRI